MITGLVAALPVEIRCLTDARHEPRIPFRINPRLAAVVSGAGPANVNQALQDLLRHDINAVISWGTCAALAPELKSGDLVLPEMVLAEEGARYPTDTSWRERVRSSLQDSRVKIHEGPLVHARNILADRKQKQDLREKTGAPAADMESTCIIKTANSLGLPCLVVRAVLDEADMAIPGSIIKHTNEFGKADIPGLARELMQAPGLIISLWTLALSLRKAVRTLKMVARRTSDTLLWPGS